MNVIVAIRYSSKEIGLVKISLCLSLFVAYIIFMACESNYDGLRVQIASLFALLVMCSGLLSH